MSTTRRAVLRGGCVAALALAITRPAEARFLGGIGDVSPQGPAPRAQCPHQGCRFWRPAPGAGPGSCGLALSGEVVPPGSHD